MTEAKPAFRSKEWMAMMRAKGDAKRAEQNKLKQAQKIKSERERQQALEEAEKLINPKPSVPDLSSVENVPIKPKRVRAKPEPRRELDLGSLDTETAPQPASPKPEKQDWHQEYYKQKLALLHQQQKQPPPPPPKAHPYQIARHDIQQHVNKTVLNDLWKTYFPDSDSPYQ